MINLILPNIFRFIGLILIQVLVVNNFSLGYYINPYVYPIIILALPFQTPHWLLMMLAFITGLTLDSFCNTMGLHAAASVFLAFIRPSVAGIMAPRGSYDIDDEPTISSLGYSWYIPYVSILILGHHFVYFYLEIFSFQHFFMTLGKIFASSFTSIILIILLATIFSSGKKRI